MSEPLWIEPSAKRVRVYLGGPLVPYYPTYFLPEADGFGPAPDSPFS
ncbi:hypothetical protein [Actinokineospora sp.]